MQRVERLKGWYEKYERRISAGSLLAGFIIDSLTLQRIDALRENLWIGFNLLLVSTCIFLINRKENKRSLSHEEKVVHFWTSNLLQFGFGAVLGTFFIFYFRSLTLSATWPFVLIILLAMFSNEIFKKHYEKLIFQVAFLFLSIFSFSIFLVPVLAHEMGPLIFVLSGVVAVLTLALYLYILAKFARERFARSKKGIAIVTALIFVSINVLYFANLIPPAPLSLKEKGAYNSVSLTQGEYVLDRRDASFFDHFRVYDHLKVRRGESAYVYSAIFSPTRLDVAIIHEWQFYDEDRGEWVSRGRIPLAVSGGRGDGYRTYSTKSSLEEGKWRVNVLTSRGQIIGRITFRVIII